MMAGEMNQPNHLTMEDEAREVEVVVDVEDFPEVEVDVEVLREVRKAEIEVSQTEVDFKSQFKLKLQQATIEMRKAQMKLVLNVEENGPAWTLAAVTAISRSEPNARNVMNQKAMLKEKETEKTAQNRQDERVNGPAWLRAVTTTTLHSEPNVKNAVNQKATPKASKEKKVKVSYVHR